MKRKMTTKSAKTIVLGVTGSIAAYKACEIASTLTKMGHNVIPVLTDSAQNMVGAATFEGLTGNRAIVEMFHPVQNGEMDHISVAEQADLFLIAPATANVLAKSAHGIADDWLTTALLVTPAPVLYAPAMNTHMYAHAAVQENIQTLTARGCAFVGPGSGVLACKSVGPGRMSEPEEVVEAALSILNGSDALAGKHILITSGANHEPIDPVRYIGNRSSGKMGRAIADEALRRGARVTVVTGPADVDPPAGAEVVQVATAQEMFQAVMDRVVGKDIVIGAAAVADYRVNDPSTVKQKRNGGGLDLTLVENPDIIAHVGQQKTNGQLIVGFAAETHDLIENAQAKLARKNLDLIVANQVGTEESGFGTETVHARFLSSNGETEEHPLLRKTELASKLFDHIEALMESETR
jgi:phosphopantothenoylcysteine decarboxylase / phosphopantothenate---cysteine ligase